MTVTRFAPSPTGFLHVGNLRAALFNWLIARKSGGTFILRLDDTDPERSTQEYADMIRRDLEWLGLTWDKEITQSSRLDRYDAAAETLRGTGQLYEAFETPTELDLKRKKLLNMGRPPVYDRSALDLTDEQKEALRAERGNGVWRFKLEQERITWEDMILGPQSIDSASVSDPVLIRADGQYLYTLASVVDDAEMGITDIVRGMDHVTNTATQIQMFRALGAGVPAFAHHSLLTGPQGEALSKRLGTLALKDMRAAGIEPMAILSLMARLGSADPVELRGTHQELIDGFEIGRFGAAPTKLDPDDLRPMTARYLHGLPFDAVSERLAALGITGDDAPEFWDMARENIEVLADVAPLHDLCVNGAEPLIHPEDAEFVAAALPLLPPRPWDDTTWTTWANAVKEATGRKGKQLFPPLRRALTGADRGPDMTKLMPLMRKTPAA
ncbi:glutamyl-tRNA synthetase [Rubricella aquisinus]|uniref:Glutamate--tRNA ligase n=1 Tax=Rubricella aquisinus TaxID=2028108 RepID=A0A840WSU5_9RHOB|nr:glutamate--tRNA ligase [Rubricella aquisinus]MBB5516742.1 glutamyl-tRNA synthetase [Rubricella aquisinus]